MAEVGLQFPAPQRIQFGPRPLGGGEALRFSGARRG
jgi:hypothetical protein